MDYVSRFILEDLDIRGAVVRLGAAWRSMQSGRNYAPVSSLLLGQMTAVTTLIGSNLKTPGRLTFQVKGDGNVSLMIVDCDEQLRLRGLVQAPPDLAPAPVATLLGTGQLTLTLYSNTENARPYQSFVPLEGDDVATIFENYLALSEQSPSRLWLMADNVYACGLFLQKLPDADKKDSDDWNRVQQLAATIKPEEFILPAETLLGRIFPEENIRLFPPREATYHCPRDEEKVVEMLRAMGRNELSALIAERGEIHIQDEICNCEYRFGAELLDRLFPAEKRTLN
jgi:molecular chaperone Hsp33